MLVSGQLTKNTGNVDNYLPTAFSVAKKRSQGGYISQRFFVFAFCHAFVLAVMFVFVFF